MVREFTIEITNKLISVLMLSGEERGVPFLMAQFLLV
jgi:hypothetical protein